MGDFADDARREELDWYFERLFNPKGRRQLVKRMQLRRLQSIETGWWRTRQDVEIEIGKMLDTHLANTIAMLERNELTNSAKYRELVTERERRSKQ